MNERIPKIKKKQIQNNLQPVDVKNRDVQDLLREVNKSCLDTEFHREWDPLEIFMVHNSKLEASFIQKRSELKDEGRSPQSLLDQLGFLAVPSFQTSPIACKGLQASKQKYNRIGKGECGVYINKYFDIELKSLWFMGSLELPREIFVFKYFYGKRKAITVNNLCMTESSLEPTPNYDCHTSSVQPSVVDNGYRQTALSSIYLYEYTEACEPSKCPRQCLPYAVIKCVKRCVPKPLMAIQVSSVKDLQSTVSKDASVKEMTQSVKGNGIPSKIHRVPENPHARNIPSILSLNPAQISNINANGLNESAMSTKINCSEMSEKLRDPVFNTANMNRTDSVVAHEGRKVEKRAEPRPAVNGFKDDFLQNQAQYLERLVAANTIVQESKSPRVIDNIGSILPVFASSLHAEDNLSKPQTTQSTVKCTIGATDVRDPRLKKQSSKPPEKQVERSMESQKISISTLDHQPKKPSKRLSLFEYMQKKNVSSDIKSLNSTSEKKTSVVKNNLQFNASNINDPSSESDIDLLPISSPEMRMMLSQNKHVSRSSALPNSKFQPPLSSQHVSSNLFQSFTSCPVSSTSSQIRAPISSARPKAKVQKLLPIPVCNEDGPVINIYRGIVNGTFQELKSLSSRLQSSTTSSVTKHMNNSEGRESLLTENLDSTKENISKEKTDPLATLMTPKPQDAHKLKKVIHNVLERQLSNSKKGENDPKEKAINEVKDQMIQQKEDNSVGVVLSKELGDVPDASSSIDEICEHPSKHVKNKLSMKNDRLKMKSDSHKKHLPADKIATDSKKHETGNSFTENKNNVMVTEKTDCSKKSESNVNHKLDKKRVTCKGDKVERKHVQNEASADRKHMIEKPDSQKRNPVIVDTKSNSTKHTAIQTNTSSGKQARNNKCLDLEQESMERKTKLKINSHKGHLPTDKLKTVPVIDTKNVQFHNVVDNDCDMEQLAEVDQDHDLSMDIEDNLLIPNRDNEDLYPRFVCRSPNADIPSINLNTLNFSANAVSSKSYCSPLRLIPSLCDDLADPVGASEELHSSESVVKESSFGIQKKDTSLSSADRKKEAEEEDLADPVGASEELHSSESLVKESSFGIQEKDTSLSSADRKKGADEEDLADPVGATEELHGESTISSESLVKESSFGTQRNYASLSSAVLPTPADMFRKNETEGDDSTDPRGATEELHDESTVSSESLVNKSSFGTQVKDTSLSIAVLSSQSDKLREKDFTAQWMDKKDLTAFTSVKESSANSMSSQPQRSNLHSFDTKELSKCQEHTMESNLNPEFEFPITNLNKCKPGLNEQMDADGSSSNQIENNVLKSVSLPLITNRDCDAYSSVGHSMGANKSDLGSGTLESLDEDIEDRAVTLPRSISMQDLGISCYLQVLSEKKYQPSTLLVDYKKAFNEDYHHSKCHVCKKELTDDNLAKHMNEDWCEDKNEGGMYSESELLIGDNCDKPSNELVEIEHLKTDGCSFESRAIISNQTEKDVGTSLVQMNSYKRKVINDCENSGLVVAELGRESCQFGKESVDCKYQELATPRLTKAMPLDDDGYGKENIPINFTSPQEIDYSITNSPVLIIAENSPDLQVDEREFQETIVSPLTSKEPKSCVEDNSQICEEDPLKDKKMCDSDNDVNRKKKLKLIRERLCERGIIKPAKWKVSAPSDKNKSEVIETKTNSVDYDDLRDSLLDDMLSISSNKTSMTSQPISGISSSESGLVLKNDHERSSKERELGGDFVEKSFPLDGDAMKTHLPRGKDEKSSCSDMLEILEADHNDDESSLMFDNPKEISCSEKSKFFGMIPRSAQKFLTKKKKCENRLNHESLKEHSCENVGQMKSSELQTNKKLEEQTILPQVTTTEEESVENSFIREHKSSKTICKPEDDKTKVGYNGEKTETKWKPINASGEGPSLVGPSEFPNVSHSKAVHFALAPRNKSDAQHYPYYFTKINACKDQTNLVQHMSEVSTVKKIFVENEDTLVNVENTLPMTTLENDSDKNDVIDISKEPTIKEENKQAVDDITIDCGNTENRQTPSNKAELKFSKDSVDIDISKNKHAIDDMTFDCGNTENSQAPSNKEEVRFSNDCVDNVKTEISSKPVEQCVEEEINDIKPFEGINASRLSVFSNQPLGDVDYRIGFHFNRQDTFCPTNIIPHPSHHGNSAHTSKDSSTPLLNQSCLSEYFQGKIDDYGDVDYRYPTSYTANRFSFQSQFGTLYKDRSWPSHGPDLTADRLSSIPEGSGVAGLASHQGTFYQNSIAECESSDKKNNNLPSFKSFDKTYPPVQHPIMDKGVSESGEDGKDSMYTSTSQLPMSGMNNELHVQSCISSAPNSSTVNDQYGQWLNPMTFSHLRQDMQNGVYNTHDGNKSHKKNSEMIDSRGEIFQKSPCDHSIIKAEPVISHEVGYQYTDTFQKSEIQTTHTVELSVANSTPSFNLNMKQVTSFNTNEVDSSVRATKALLETERALGGLKKDMPKHSVLSNRLEQNYETGGEYHTSKNACNIDFMPTYSALEDIPQSKSLSPEELLRDNKGIKHEVTITPVCGKSSEDKDAESHSALDNIRKWSSKMCLQKIKQEIANTYSDEEGSDDDISDAVRATKVPDVKEGQTSHTELNSDRIQTGKLSLSNDHLFMLQKAIDTVKALAPRTKVCEKDETLPSPVCPLSVNASSSDCHSITSSKPKEVAGDHERTTNGSEKNFPAASEIPNSLLDKSSDNLVSSKSSNTGSKSSHVKEDLVENVENSGTIADKLKNVAALCSDEGVMKSLSSDIVSALVTLNKHIQNKETCANVLTDVTLSDEEEGKNANKHSEISKSSHCSSKLLSDHSSTAENKKVSNNDIENDDDSDSKKNNNSNSEKSSDSDKETSSHTSAKNEGQKKVLLSEVPMEFLTVARLHLLTQLVSLNDNTEDNISDFKKNEEEGEDGEICEASVSEKESIHSTSETDELLQDSDHRRSVVVDHERKIYRALKKKNTDIVVISSDSDSGIVSKVSNRDDTNTKKWKVIRDKPVHSSSTSPKISSLTRKLKRDHIEVVSSESDSSDRSNSSKDSFHNEESPRVVKFKDLKIHLDNSYNTDKKEKTVEKSLRVVTVGTSPVTSKSEERFRDNERWINVSKNNSSERVRSGSRDSSLEPWNGDEKGKRLVVKRYKDRSKNSKDLSPERHTSSVQQKSARLYQDLSPVTSTNSESSSAGHNFEDQRKSSPFLYQDRAFSPDREKDFRRLSSRSGFQDIKERKIYDKYRYVDQHRQHQESRSPSLSGSGYFSSNYTTSRESSFSPKKKPHSLRNNDNRLLTRSSYGNKNANTHQTRIIGGRSDLIEYFSPERDNDLRNRHSSPSQRSRVDARSHFEGSSYRERQHPLDELMKPLLKRKTIDSDQELDYYLGKKKRHCENGIYPSFRR